MKKKHLLLAIVGIIVLTFIALLLFGGADKPATIPPQSGGSGPAIAADGTGEGAFDAGDVGFGYDLEEDGLGLSEGDGADGIDGIDGVDGVDGMDADPFQGIAEDMRGEAGDRIRDLEERVAALEAALLQWKTSQAEETARLAAATAAAERAATEARRVAPARPRATPRPTAEPTPPPPPPPPPTVELGGMSESGQTILATVTVPAQVSTPGLLSSGARESVYSVVGNVVAIPGRNTLHGVTVSLNNDYGAPTITVGSSNNIDVVTQRVGDVFQIAVSQDVPLGLASEQRWVVRALLQDTAAIYQPSTQRMATVSVGSMVVGYGLVTRLDQAGRSIITERGIIEFER